MIALKDVADKLSKIYICQKVRILCQILQPVFSDQPDSGGKAGRLADLCLIDFGGIFRLGWSCTVSRGRVGRGAAQGNVGKG